MPANLNPQRVTRHVRNKGHRLHTDGRAHRLPGSFVVLVEGDTLGVDGAPLLYAVSCDAEGQALGCTCPHHGLCGHVMAAHELNEAEA
jgi:hypothetical protein